jgi:hypothetical protein
MRTATNTRITNNTPRLICRWLKTADTPLRAVWCAAPPAAQTTTHREKGGLPA